MVVILEDAVDVFSFLFPSRNALRLIDVEVLFVSSLVGEEYPLSCWVVQLALQSLLELANVVDVIVALLYDLFKDFEDLDKAALVRLAPLVSNLLVMFPFSSLVLLLLGFIRTAALFVPISLVDVVVVDDGDVVVVEFVPSLITFLLG